jgi:hypothetical protein
MDIKVTAHGGTVKKVMLTVSSTRAKVVCDSSGNRTYQMGKIKYSKTAAITVSIPSNVTSGKVTINATVDGNIAKASDRHTSFTVTKPTSTPSPSPSPTPSSTHSAGSGGGSGSGNGAAGSNTSMTPMGTLTSSTGGNSGSSGTPPQNAPALPDLTQQQPPTTAPDPIQHTGNSQSMRGSADGANQLTFGKLASTQAAWLAALLVAFSLLLTQVRLGKATTKDVRPKGTHRKPRRASRTRAH